MTVPATTRNHVCDVLGFVTRPDETVVDADVRLVSEGRDRIGQLPGWDKDAYNQHAAAKVADSGAPLHPDDAEDMGALMNWTSEDMDEFDNAVTDTDVGDGLRRRYVAEAKQLLDQMPATTGPVLTPIFDRLT